MRPAWQWFRDNRHYVLGWAWITLLPPALLWWSESVLFVILMSIYANAEASFAAHQAKKQRTDSAPPTDKDPHP